MNEMMDALSAEIRMRKQELPATLLDSVYLGGGTPSILPEPLLLKLFEQVNTHFTLKTGAEVTIEANPDDVTPQKLAAIRQTPVNRFSMGVQSFFDEDLLWMNRAHKAHEAESSIKMIQDAGFDKISIDLIYGGPTLTNGNWQKNLQKTGELSLNHISAYCLTVEPGTALQSQINKGKLRPLNEEKAAVQFDMMVDHLEASGFEQYEISNFARNGEYAKHNTSYWQNKPYLGIGPSAHSFNGGQRSWNVANNLAYIKNIAEGKIPQETETLTLENRINEYIMTGLRTMWGCNDEYILQAFGKEFYKLLQHKLLPYIGDGRIERTPDGFKLARHSRILADGIASDLFF
jgi:oxygen-independent coproporphyrinogen III oxidase